MSDRASLLDTIARVKERLSMRDVLEMDGVELRRAGRHWVACCPFHGERTPSFTVHFGSEERAHCYGCGWDGDVIDYWRSRRGVRLEDALASLTSFASLPVYERSRKIQAARVPRVADVTSVGRRKPQLPRMRGLRGAEVEALAGLRGLRAAGVGAAVRDRRVGWSMWPQFERRDGLWGVSKDAVGSWVVTDDARWVAQWRAMDGSNYTVRRAMGESASIKAWTKGSPAWPLGAGQIGERACVVMVEGGADMLAAYDFLDGYCRLDVVAVVAMLGASNRIAEDALPSFARKRVRIIMDEDDGRVVQRVDGAQVVRAGVEAAARWTAQLTAVGAAVETFSLAGWFRRDGQRVKDLNDLAMMDGARVNAEVRQAFFDFDF